MPDVNYFRTFGAAFVGAIVYELINWYDKRATLEQKKYRRIYRSPSYIVVTLAMAIGAAICANIWYDGEVAKLRDYTLFGAAFPILFKKLAVSLALRGRDDMGAEEPESLRQKLHDWFLP
jgi:hypothetical protein